MIWNTTIEPKSEIDSGMMPPPLSLPLGRRSSSSTDQLSPPLLNTLKSELMDETSQNSESSFHSNENSMDSTALYTTNSGPNMEIMNENSMIVSNNFMIQQQQQQIVPTTSEVIDLRVQQEQQRQQLYSEQNYLSNLESNVQQLKLQVEANLFSQQLATTSSQQQQSTFNVTEISDSPNHSPLSQDIILNSQSVVVSLQNDVLTTQQQQQQGINMSSEIILNSAVSPSMMCQTSPDPMLNTMSSMNQQSQETIMNTMLPSVVLHKQPSVAVKNMILNAAAEILTSQQTQTPITTGGPMNELISSLTPITTNMLAEQSQNMIMTQAPSNAQNDILCQHQQSQVTQQMEQQMVNAIFSSTNVLPNMMSEVPVATTMMSNGMTNLINQEIRNAVNEELQIRRAQVEYLQAVRDDQMNGEIRYV